MKKVISDSILAFAGMLMIISLSVIITLSFRPLYYMDMKSMHLSEIYGYEESEIVENYRELIDYNLSPFHRELKFPTFPMSEEARIHFREVKAIFQGFLKTGIVALLFWCLGSMIKCRRGEFGYLILTGIVTIVIPSILGVLICCNWDYVFIRFHELAFQNDYWMFDPVTDPIIDVLPDAFFMHCAVMIIGIAIAASVICILTGWKKMNDR